ncbi:hypothetical protein RRG08_018018 [Elysia crispata]|uniref:Guanine nucleotide-binding protein subunit gamma n=1 Tax=Elysia crispata TaxID=231223 RepID=A0AAE1DE48_9GAST|nr:hypothetical protein RRG08_018018 [Elysia crispata]
MVDILLLDRGVRTSNLGPTWGDVESPTRNISVRSGAKLLGLSRSSDELFLVTNTYTEPTMNKFQEGLQQQRRLIEQLRCEAQITRFRVSQCIDDLQKYCDSHIEEDYLIRGFSKPSENPFKEKGSCAIL